MTRPRINSEPLAGGMLSPLDYLLSIVRNPNEDPRRRDKAAIAALPYCHAKGKKEVAAAAAKAAGKADGWGSDLEWPQ